MGFPVPLQLASCLPPDTRSDVGADGHGSVKQFYAISVFFCRSSPPQFISPLPSTPLSRA
ncbi:hypothetical protein SCHPADRAFT_948201 [Schizopora paradoxa]|uniref:Uncharacterized protein n=1 Tax=Schizopora paradoxa TaxID=27342 RepID=A0A0H2QWI5_9AGAM|nr:hypothetical protein SCHPADRAFT_948201 [Schizopora paradoxa]